MNEKNYRISKIKYKKAVELLILGTSNYTDIAKTVGISRNTLQKIREDKKTAKIIKEYTDNEIKNAVGKAGRTLIALLDSPSETVRFDAAKHILSLNGIQVTDKLEVESQNVVIVDDV